MIPNGTFVLLKLLGTLSNSEQNILGERNSF